MPMVHYSTLWWRNNVVLFDGMPLAPAPKLHPIWVLGEGKYPERCTAPVAKVLLAGAELWSPSCLGNLSIA